MRSFTCVPFPAPCGPKNNTLTGFMLLESIALFLEYRHDFLDRLFEPSVGVHDNVIIKSLLFLYLSLRVGPTLLDLDIGELGIALPNAPLQSVNILGNNENGGRTIVSLVIASAHEVGIHDDEVTALDLLLKVRRIRSIVRVTVLDICRFENVPCLFFPLKLLLREKIVINTVLFSRARRARRGGYQPLYAREYRSTISLVIVLSPLPEGPAMTTTLRPSMSG